MPPSAVSSLSPVGSLFSNGLRMRVCLVCLCRYSTGIVRNALICEYANGVHTSCSFRTHTHTHTHTHILIPFEDSVLTGLKVKLVDIASSVSHCSWALNRCSWNVHRSVGYLNYRDLNSCWAVYEKSTLRLRHDVTYRNPRLLFGIRASLWTNATVAMLFW